MNTTNWHRQSGPCCGSAGAQPASRHHPARWWLVLLSLSAMSGAVLADSEASSKPTQPHLAIFPTPTGATATLSAADSDERNNPFFQSLGTNGRSCNTCHTADQAMSVSPPKIRERYDRTHGYDPLFAPFDGANCDTVRRSDERGHSLLLKHGLIRIELPIPANAEFDIAVVRDPYGCAIQYNRPLGARTISVYRRPLPATNLRTVASVMWDGREVVKPLEYGAQFIPNLKTDLAQQALSAIMGHAQAVTPPSRSVLNAIVNYELGLTTAQISDNRAGRLDVQGGSGGPVALSKEPYYPLINDVLGQDPTGRVWDPHVITIFDAWSDGTTQTTGTNDVCGDPAGQQTPAVSVQDSRNRARADIVAGQHIFNCAGGNITTVRGLNDEALGDNGIGPESPGSPCTTCHEAPNAGNMSRPLMMDIGTTHAASPGLETDPQILAGMQKLDRPELPLYLISGCSNPFYPGQPASFYTSDPGRALISGKCEDLNRVKVPILRGLAGRAPYFHDGSARTLGQLVDFYDKRFQMSLTREQKRQLEAFLNSL
jgi:cytochrome c peroxidase